MAFIYKLLELLARRDDQIPQRPDRLCFIRACVTTGDTAPFQRLLTGYTNGSRSDRRQATQDRAALTSIALARRSNERHQDIVKQAEVIRGLPKEKKNDSVTATQLRVLLSLTAQLFDEGAAGNAPRVGFEGEGPVPAGPVRLPVRA